MKIKVKFSILVIFLIISLFSNVSTQASSNSEISIVPNQVPYLEISYNPYLTDHDGDTFGDTIQVDFTLITSDISDWIRVYMEIYKYNSTTNSSEYYLDSVYVDVYVDSVNPNSNSFLEYHVRETGDFEIRIYANYDTASVWYVSQLYNIMPDKTPFPVTWFAWVNKYNADSSFGNDSFDIWIHFDFYEFYDTAMVSVYGSHANGSDIGYWNENIFGENSSQEIVFSGVAPFDGDYSFYIQIWDGDEWTSQTVSVFTLYAYSDPHISMSVSNEKYDWDGDDRIDSIEIYLNLNYVNLWGEYSIIFTVKWWDGVSWIPFETQNDRSFLADGIGTYNGYFSFSAPHGGDYQFEFAIWYDIYWVNEIIEWFGATAYDGGYYFDQYINWWTEDRGNYQGQDDTVTFELYFKNSWFTPLNFDFEIVISIFNQTSSQYDYVSTMGELIELGANEEIWINQEFMAHQEGDYIFEINIVVDGVIVESRSEDIYLYLGIFEEAQPEIFLNLFADESDLDGDNQPDHINFVLSINYQNLPFSNLEIKVYVIYNGVNETVTQENFQLEGWGDYETSLEYRAEDDTVYFFMFELLLEGELWETKDFDWDGHQYDPNSNQGSTNDGNTEDEDSTTPDLPVPAGDFYLFLVAVFSSTILLRRRQE